MEPQGGAAFHSDFDALLRAQPGACSAVEYSPAFGGHGGVLVTRSIPNARSNSSDAVQQWWRAGAQTAGDTPLSLESCPAGSAPHGLIFSRISPSGKFVANFRKVSTSSSPKEAPILEIRTSSGVVVARSDLKKAHGDVISPSWFGGACWSQDERCLYYTAEAKRAEPTHFWDAADSARATTPTTPTASKDTASEAKPQGNVHDYVDDWGEQNTGTMSPCVFRVEPWSGAAPVQVPLSPALSSRLGWGQPLVTPDNKWLIVTAWANHPRRLGSIYCMQRPSGVYAVHLKEWLSSLRQPEPGAAAEGGQQDTHDPPTCAAVLLSAGEVQARSARLSPCGGKLVFLGRDGHAAPGDAVAAADPQAAGILRTHNGAFALRGFAMAAWQAAGCPRAPCVDAARPPQSDPKAEADGVQYKQGLLPVQECADSSYLSTLLPVVDDPGTAPREDKPVPGMGGAESSFPGLYTVMLPRHAWSADSAALALHTVWFSRTVAILLKVHEAAGDGGAAQLRVGGAVTSLSPGQGGLPSPQEVLKGALRQAGALAVAPPSSPGALSPTARRSAAHSAYLSVSSHGWIQGCLLAQVHCPVAGSYLATAAVDWEHSTLQFESHASPAHQHVQELVAAQHAMQLCTPLPSAAAVAGSRSPLQAAGALASLSWKVLRVQPLHQPDVGFVEGILVLPPHDTPRPPAGYPLIVMPHGGPHGAYPTVQFHSVCLFALAGYAVVTVNYRGSTGFGERSLAALPGACGTMDVLDCLDTAAAVAGLAPGGGMQWSQPEALAHFHAASGACVECGAPDRQALLAACAGGAPLAGPVDCTRISVIGGSHGGFLAAHLAGQFPDVFRAAVARNPVIDISQMVGVTDIPDWCWVEALGIGAPQGGYDYSSFATPDGGVLAAMRACSPIEHAHKVKAAVLLTTGAKDRRVPASQSVLYYHSLRALGKTCRMQWYPEDCHPLSTASTDADALVHMLLWLQEHAAVRAEDEA